MVYLGQPNGVKGYLFMRLHNNMLFTAATALFDEQMFPKCPEGKKGGHTELGEEQPNNDSNGHNNGDNNIPPEDDDDDLFPSHPSQPF